MDKKYIKRFSILTLLSLIVLFAAGNPATAQKKEPDVIYVPTPDTVVQKMLEMADVEPGDYVIDLGSGDGRIVLAAARKGAYAHGVEIDDNRLREARSKAAESGVDQRISFVKGDLFETDLKNANVITLYLLQSLNIKLRPRLLRELEPGSRVVSHSFDMGDWKADRKVYVEGNQVYLWIIPAKVEGTWKWSVNGEPFTADIEQQFQQIKLMVQSGEATYATREVVLHGKRISFIADRGDVQHVYSGEVEGDTIVGFVQIHTDSSKTVKSWKAKLQ